MKLNEWRMKHYLTKYCNKPRGKKVKKTKQINNIIEKEREIQKLIYSINPKNYVTELFTIKSPIT